MFIQYLMDSVTFVFRSLCLILALPVLLQEVKNSNSLQSFCSSPSLAKHARKVVSTQRLKGELTKKGAPIQSLVCWSIDLYFADCV